MTIVRHYEFRARSHGIDLYVLLFSATLFLSAALMFTAQPMIGKMMLPMIGGAPGGWLVTMAYFQLGLLAGYGLAFGLTRLPARIHMAAVCVLLLSGLLMLPLHMRGDLIAAAGLPESFGLALTLVTTLTLPVVALAALSPSLQRLFASGASRQAPDPYFLFAASNLGSFGGLLLYPLLIERTIGLSMQAEFWRGGYIALMALCALCLSLTWRATVPRDASPVMTAPSPPLSWRTRGFWVVLAFIPSSLMLGISSFITTDTGSVPFFWVLPLALYLLTFVLAFREQEPSTFRWLAVAQAMSVAFLPLAMYDGGFGSLIGLKAVLSLLAFYLTARLCHGMLAARRPAAPRLTEFYLWIAIGGALGGSFNAFLAPLIFPLPVEFMLVAWLSYGVHLGLRSPPTPKLDRWVYGACFIAAGATLALMMLGHGEGLQKWRIIARGAQVASIAVASFRPPLLAGFVIGIAALLFWSALEEHPLIVKRNFFGVLLVNEFTVPTATLRALKHGTTMHGIEKVGPVIDTTPSTYYDPDGPLGDMMAAFRPQDVAMVGLGTGAAVCYRAAGRRFTVYEIDPDVVNLAATRFDYFNNCGTPDIHIGDGRKLLERESGTRYDFLILDAFTSDAIPFHLLTQEAVKTYFNRLRDGGVLALHVSNGFYALDYPVSNLAAALGLYSLEKHYSPAPGHWKWPLKISSQWIALARRPEILAPLRAYGWEDLPPPEGRAWTDDFSDTLSALRLLHPSSLKFSQRAPSILACPTERLDDAQTH